MIVFKHSGNFNKTEKFLNKMKKNDLYKSLKPYAEQGVSALASATPIDSGRTASCWEYKISRSRNSVKIEWKNTNVNKGVPIAIILQYGHGTRNGGYVQGRDYINPAIRPIFDKITEEVWKEVTTA